MCKCMDCGRCVEVRGRVYHGPWDQTQSLSSCSSTHWAISPVLWSQFVNADFWLAESLDDLSLHEAHETLLSHSSFWEGFLILTEYIISFRPLVSVGPAHRTQYLFRGFLPMTSWVARLHFCWAVVVPVLFALTGWRESHCENYLFGGGNTDHSVMLRFGVKKRLPSSMELIFCCLLCHTQAGLLFQKPSLSSPMFSLAFDPVILPWLIFYPPEISCELRWGRVLRLSSPFPPRWLLKSCLLV